MSSPLFFMVEPCQSRFFLLKSQGFPSHEPPRRHSGGPQGCHDGTALGLDPLIDGEDMKGLTHHGIPQINGLQFFSGVQIRMMMMMMMMIAHTGIVTECYSLVLLLVVVVWLKMMTIVHRMG